MLGMKVKFRQSNLASPPMALQARISPQGRKSGTDLACLF